MRAAVPGVLIVSVALGAGVGAAPAKGQDPARGKTPARSFTDDDLARYREERLRRERDPGDAAVAPPPPVAPVEPVATAAPVVLEDLNRSLPPEFREQAESVGRYLVRFFGVQGDDSLVIPLRYFPAEADYQEYLGRNVPGDVMWTGFFDPMKGEIVVGGGDEALAVLMHEVNHFVVEQVFEEAPTWFDEGLAEYFEGARVGPKGLTVSDKPRHRRRLAAWLEGGREPDLRQLLAAGGWTSIAPGFEHERLVRSLSWSVVSFMMSSEEGEDVLHGYMDRLKEHRGRHSLVVLDRTWPGGAPGFERQWLEYLERTAGDP
jgi:hypothetical protein